MRGKTIIVAVLTVFMVSAAVQLRDKLILCSHRLTPPYRSISLFFCFLSYSPHRSAISEYILSRMSRS